MTQREKDNETEIAQVLALPPPPQQRQTFSDESPTESKKLIQLSKYNLKKATKYGCKKYNAKRFSKCSTSKRVRKNAAWCSKSDRFKLCKLESQLEVYLNFTTTGLRPNILHTNNETI